jgi:hypothetical protein
MALPSPIYRAFWLVTAVACSAPSDTSLYVEAIERAPEGMALCHQIREEALRSDCISWNAQAQLHAGEQSAAEASCEQLPLSSRWRDECYFQLADHLKAHPQQARRLCDLTGSYQAWCHNHIVRNAIEAQFSELPRGGEDAIEQRAREQASSSLPPEDAASTARHVVARLIAARRDAPFDRDLSCGSASERTCIMALEERLLDQAWSNQPDPVQVRQRLALLCRHPLDVESAEAAGFVGWTPTTGRIARRAWARVCSRLSGEGELLRPMLLPTDRSPR